MTLPKGIPEANFWSFTLYDNETRSMLDTPQRYPRAGSQSDPSPAAEPDADGAMTIYFSPTQPEGIRRGNWIQDRRLRQRLVHAPAPLQPTRAFLHQRMATERGRSGAVEGKHSHREKHFAAGRGMAAICAFETFERPLESTLSSRSRWRWKRTELRKAGMRRGLIHVSARRNNSGERLSLGQDWVRL